MFARVPISRSSWPRLAAAVAALLSLASLPAGRSLAGTAPAPAVAAATAPTLGGFVHVATAGNTTANLTLFDNPLTNGITSTLAFITPNWNPGSVTDDHPAGVQYDAGHSEWGIAHQDSAVMLAGAAFNVLVAAPAPSAFTLGGFSGSDNSAIINSPLTNNNPNALVFLAWDSTPAGGAGAYNPHPPGVFYDTSTNAWWVFNEDFQAMPTTGAFNVLVRSANGVTFLHVATAANSAGDHTMIDHPMANGNPSAILLVTPNWNPGGQGGITDAHNIGVRYDATSQRWTIFHEDGSGIPAGAAFNVAIYATSVFLPEVLK